MDNVVNISVKGLRNNAFYIYKAIDTSIFDLF